MSDLVVHGRVLAQARAWWNGTDGLRWTADRPGAQPMLYSTWIIQVWGVFKGATPAGALLAVRTEGGELPTDSGGVVMLPKHGWPQMAADDQVVVFLVQDDNRYQGVYEPPGFWLATGAGSVMKRAEDGRFVRQGVTASAAGAMAPEELFALFEKLASQAEVPGHQGQERWSSGALTLDRVRELLTQKLPAGAALILPGTLPAGWAV
ncbi:MAG: hypothetical protein H5T84_03595, partial [Thermoleophilia bacterium]|nr:hypothetical protein [Thermoleophilia bacterium]